MLRPDAEPPHRAHEQLVRPGLRGARLTAPADLSADLDDPIEPLTPGGRFALVVGPLAGLAVVLLFTWLVAGGPAAGFLASMALGAFVGGGKLVILAGAVEQAPLGTWPLASLIVYIDVATALVVMGGMTLIYRIPGAGPRMVRAREAGWRLLQRHPWTRHAAWLSLAGFVAVPFNGTGALVGAFVGRMMGLSRPAILTATFVGSSAGAVALATAGTLWAERVDAVASHPVLAPVAVVTVATLAILATKWMFGGESTENVSYDSTGE